MYKTGEKSVKYLSEVDSDPCQTYKMEYFAEIVNG